MNLQLTLFPEMRLKASEMLVIIGNGFDLAHGIESSYWHFREWLCKNQNRRLVHMMDIFFSNQDDVWNRMEQTLGEYGVMMVLFLNNRRKRTLLIG